jgi:predicted ATPase/DNA-binding CsgD family transcriptional regulator
MRWIHGFGRTESRFVVRRPDGFIPPERQGWYSRAPGHNRGAKVARRAAGVGKRLHNLPAEPSTFVGREWELGELPNLLASTRVLTLTGPGGVGKTRLALRLGTAVLDAYPDGVWLVELAPLLDGRLLPQALAATLRVREAAGRSVLEQLRDELRGRHMLLLLDNCEHLIEACAQVVEDLLRACPGLRVLATSRESLGSHGEMIWRVGALRLPGRSTSTPEQLNQSEAVRLFVERARAVQPAFTLSDRNARLVALICRRLDGLPLALELAAARVSVLSVSEIADRLDDRFRLLVSGRRTAPARQQTLRATLDWTYGLLSEPEKRLFERLAVFAGGCSLEMAEHVCGQDGLQQPEVLDVLGRLVDKSVVTAEPEAGGTSRYRLHETIRQYGLERLNERGALDDARQRHAEYFAVWVQSAELELRGDRQAAWLDWLESEHDNLRVALAWALEKAQKDVGLRLGAALWRFWLYRGHLTEGENWLGRLLAHGGPATPAHLRALFGAGMLARARGETAAGRERFEECRRLAMESGDQERVAAALTQLGQIAREGGELAAAREMLAQALTIRASRGNQWGIAASLEELGYVALRAGDRPTALHLFTEALALVRELADRTRVGFLLCSVGEVQLADGDVSGARARFGESLALFRELGHAQGLARALFCCARLALAEGEPQRALRLFGASAAQRDAFGYAFTWLSEGLDPSAAAARQVLGEATADAAIAAGRALSVEQAIEEGIQPAPVEREAAPPDAGRRRLAGGLTEREAEVLRLVARGSSNRDVAAQLVLSERTVARHLANIFNKLNVGSRTAAAAFAHKYDLAGERDQSGRASSLPSSFADDPKGGL